MEHHHTSNRTKRRERNKSEKKSAAEEKKKKLSFMTSTRWTLRRRMKELWSFFFFWDARNPMIIVNLNWWVLCRRLSCRPAVVARLYYSPSASPPTCSEEEEEENLYHLEHNFHKIDRPRARERRWWWWWERTKKKGKSRLNSICSVEREREEVLEQSERSSQLCLELETAAAACSLLITWKLPFALSLSHTHNGRRIFFSCRKDSTDP